MLSGDNRASAPKKRTFAAAIIACVILVPTGGFWPGAAQTGSSTDPAAGTGRTEPAKPTGGGPTSGEAAPAPPAEQTVILPSASGHTNSAAPTMYRNCDAVPRGQQGSPDNATDPCRKPAEPRDAQSAPEMSK